MASRLDRIDRSRALHQNAGDDLEAVGHPMLQLLQQDRLLSQEVVLELLGGARVGDVGDRHQ